MNAYLFVYGSLMSSAGHPMGERLRGEAQLVGPATLQGRLYRISWYPGAVVGTDPDEKVYGEVYALRAPANVLAWLDAYEGIRLAEAGENEYERLERKVLLASGAEITAWVYLYRGDAAKLERVPDGRWTPRSR